MVVNYKGIQCHHQADTCEVEQFEIVLKNRGQVVASYPRSGVSVVMNGQAVVYPTGIYPL